MTSKVGKSSAMNKADCEVLQPMFHSFFSCPGFERTPYMYVVWVVFRFKKDQNDIYIYHLGILEAQMTYICRLVVFEPEDCPNAT